MAQSGSAPGLGPGGPRFESLYSDQQYRPMKKLYICGDSFASLVHNQEQGKSWSEIVATKQSLVLENLARPAASNVSIAMQIDYLLPSITNNDLVIILLTDHFRLTVATSPVAHNKPLLPQMRAHEQQQSHPVYQGDSLLSVNITNPKWQKYFEHGYDPLIQHFVELHTLRSLITQLKAKTDNYLIISGGWGRKLTVSNNIVELFQVPESAVLSLTQEQMSALNIGNTAHINHLDNMGHAKLANIILTKLNRSSHE